jgi:hypothetical protein
MVEVLIALTVLIIGAMGSLRLLGVAGVNNQLTKERVLATNLSREGIEAVRNIRDTNWLRFAGERRICWNNLDTTACSDVDNDGVADSPIRNNQAYLAVSNTDTYRWQLSSGSISNRLNLDDSEISSDAIYRLKLDPATGLYNHNTGEDSPYYREIYTEYLNADQTAASGTSANILRITSRVQWVDRGKISEVTLTTILTDYLARQNHD